ncbi:MAG: glycosyltransferase, partial [Nanoarchaeota archaeon]|nr:glycosyltransferase [Nanoarchaeota archaeon]
MASKKIKLLLFTDNYNPNGGGAEKVFFNLIKEFKKENIKVNSFGFGSNNTENKNYKIIKETKYLFFRHFWRLFFNVSKYIQIRRYVKKINPDVIHIHNINKYTPSLLLALRGFNVIQTVHDYSLICPTL